MAQPPPGTHRPPGGHWKHSPPPVPQSIAVSPGWQLLLASQHPSGHVSSLQGVVTPQNPSVHVPVGPQSVHSWPPVPQLRARVPALQVPSVAQQPAQFPGPQPCDTHVPLLHAWFAPHIAHETPPTPQRPGGMGSGAQTLPRQQVAQFAELHAASVHDCVVGLHTSPLAEHDWHACPAVPHAALSWPPTHIKPPMPFGWQQPLAQFTGPQPIGTPSQVWVTGSHSLKPSATQFSQACPPLPQALIALPTWHAPVLSQQPVAQVPGPHVPGVAQTPTTGLHVVPGAQEAQAWPWMPQATSLFPGKQAPDALQQPSGHDSMSHLPPSGRGASVRGASVCASGAAPSKVAPTSRSVRSPQPAHTARLARRSARVGSSLARRVGRCMGHS